MSSSLLLPPPEISPQQPDLYEVVNGEIEENQPMGARASTVTMRLMIRLGSHVERNRLGWFVCETLFRLDAATNLQRRPDVAFVSAAKWPLERAVPESDPWDVVPDLAIEVNSPSNNFEKVLEKLDDYFDAGVQQVWLIVPPRSRIYIFDSPTKIRGLSRSDVLEEATLFPGFQLPLTELFLENAPQ